MATGDAVCHTVELEGYNTWIIAFTVSTFQACQSEYASKHGDVILASYMKTGTTWMKALLHSMLTCVHSLPNLLQEKSPHSIVPCIEMSDIADWRDIPSPRLLATHLPFHSLPPPLTHDIKSESEAAQNSAKIVYLTRNPRDTFVSLWKFAETIKETRPGFEEIAPSKESLLESFCDGHWHGGDFADHVLGYLKESQRHPEQVLFVRYEDLLADCEGFVCKIGDFLGYPSEVIRQEAGNIVKKCSFTELSNLDINKTDGSDHGVFPPNRAFFGTGKGRGWKQHFTPEMEELIRVRIEDKLDKGGLSFRY